MEEICRIIEKALKKEEGSVSLNDSARTIQEWDSLNFLAILMALEERFGERIGAIDDLASATSVRELVAILKGEGII